jgi:hypothetical protein
VGRKTARRRKEAVLSGERRKACSYEMQEPGHTAFSTLPLISHFPEKPGFAGDFLLIG